MATSIRFVDFQVPPAEPGWYGVICDAGDDLSTIAAYWTGGEWLNHPRLLPWLRSSVRFETEEQADDWLESQRQPP